MKKSFLTAFLAFGVMLGASVSFGQNNAPTCIKYPNEAQGFLVFNNYDYNTITLWQLQIEQLVVSNTDSTWRLINQLRTSLNFVKISNEYVYPEIPIRIKIKGFNANNVLEAEEDWYPAAEGNSGVKFVKTIRCVGKTYHWALSVHDKVDENGNPSGGGAHVFHSGGGHLMALGVNQPLMWLQQNNTSNMTSYLSSRHYSAEKYYWSHLIQGLHEAGISLMMNNIQATDNIRDFTGALITSGSRFVVLKGLGKWGNHGGTTFETPDSGSSLVGDLGQASYGPPYTTTIPNLQGWVNLINTFTNIDCACAPITNFTGPGGGAGTGGSGSGGSGVLWKWSTYNFFLDNPIAPNPTTVFETLEAIREIFSLNEDYEHDNNIPWWPASEASHIFIFPLSVNGELGGEPIQLSKHMVVNEDGTINSFSFNLNRGLYLIKIYSPEYGFLDKYIEIEQSGTQTYPFSNYFNATIYPIPLSSNQNLTVSATTLFNMTYEYTMSDDNGNILEHKIIRSRENEEYKFVFDSNMLPSGQLFHKFVFSDGSQLIYNSIKM